MALPTLRLPDHIRPASYNLERQHKILTSDPVSGKHRMQTRLIGEPYHTLKLRYDPIHRDDFGALIPFLNNLRGQHDTFGVIIPNYTKTVTGLVEGNYLTTTTNKTRQVLEAGTGVNTELLSALTSGGGGQFTNSIAVTTGTPVGIYFDVPEATSGVTIDLFTGTNGAAGLVASASYAVNQGRNVHFLTPTLTGAVYVRITSTNVTLNSMSMKSGFLKSFYSTTLAPALSAAHDSSFIMPLPAALMKVSLNGPVQKVEYGSNSLIRIELDLIERE
tara:strand:- start:3257 stop:4081 length:825 start_codon:yes stop_codon:yes gene_type:complete